ncbi:MAG: cupin domain-containing protein [Rikenellaceae bacterium]|nr:cupin domain-containing protein [Rikenellaceae bacterium]
MATVFKSSDREFQETPGKIDNFRLFSDVSRMKKGVEPRNLNFDLRQLNPGQYSSTYHFHRYSEELFVIVSGEATLRTPKCLEIVEAGDLIFFEMEQSGAHQLYNHTEEPCIYVDIRSFIGYDVCEYPDSDKLLLVPSMEVFKRNSGLKYFDGEENIKEKWEELK